MKIEVKTVRKFITIMNVTNVSLIQSRALDIIAIHVVILICVRLAMSGRVIIMNCKKYRSRGIKRLYKK